MKQLRLFLLALLLGLASCFTDDFSPTGGEGEPADPHAVGMDRALADLQSVLSGIDGPTRSASRTIGTVGTVSKADVSRTRSAAEGNLVYVVSFPEGGYAVLGADDRLPSVIAVVEQGSLTAERYAEMALDGVPVDPSGQFEVFPDIIFGEEDIAAFDIGGGGIGGFGPIGGGGGGPIGGGGGGGLPGPITDFDPISPPPPFPTTYGPWETTSSEVYVLTKWDQGLPYNFEAPLIDGKPCLAGCVAVAIAQIMTSHAYRSQAYPTSINNTFINWSLICRALPFTVRFDEDDKSGEAMAVAHLMRMLGDELGMDYGLKSSGAYTTHAEECFARNGYQGVSLSGYTSQKVMAMLNKKFPAYVAAESRTGDKARHAWVIDGKLVQQRWKEWYNNVNKHIEKTYEGRTLLHHNFGWGGYCDGFYAIDVFNLTNGPEVVGNHDGGGSTDMNYLYDRRIITYTGVVRK